MKRKSRFEIVSSILPFVVGIFMASGAMRRIVKRKRVYFGRAAFDNSTEKKPLHMLAAQ